MRENYLAGFFGQTKERVLHDLFWGFAEKEKSQASTPFIPKNFLQAFSG